MGVGQCFRYHMGSNLFWPYVRERGMWSLTAAICVATGLGAFFWALATRNFIWTGLWIFLLALLIVAAAWGERSFRLALLCVFHRPLLVRSFLRGVLMETLSRE